MKNLRQEKETIKHRNTQLTEELKSPRAQLQQMSQDMDHLIYEVCLDTAKNLVTRCHGFCRGCITTVFRQSEDEGFWFDDSVPL